MTLRLKPCGLREANRLVEKLHRHHPPVRGYKFAVTVTDESGEVRGVAVAGRPVARKLDDGFTLEIVRVATDGTDNTPSMLYGACRRAAWALGYTKVITYTLPEEGGASLRAAGFIKVAETDGGKWSRPSRPRHAAKFPTSKKWRWEVSRS